MTEPPEPVVLTELRDHVLVITAIEGPRAFAEGRTPVWKAR